MYLVGDVSILVETKHLRDVSERHVLDVVVILVNIPSLQKHRICYYR